MEKTKESPDVKESAYRKDYQESKGAGIVTSPQETAAADVRKSAKICLKTGINYIFVKFQYKEC